MANETIREKGMTEMGRENEGRAMKTVADLLLTYCLDRYFAQRGQKADEESELVARLGGELGIKFFVAHVADRTGEGYVFWERNRGVGQDVSCIEGHATREEALFEARETYDRALAIYPQRILGDDTEWLAEN